MSEQSDTPRTDLAAFTLQMTPDPNGTPARLVEASVCEEIERELAAARAEVERLTNQNKLFRNETLICADCDAVRKEDYDRALEQRDRLAGALERILPFVDPIIGNVRYTQAQEALQYLTTNAKVMAPPDDGTKNL